MKKYCLLFIILLSWMGAFCQTEASIKTYTLSGVRVEGAEFSDENGIIKLSGLGVGEPIEIPGEAVGDAIRRLWKESIFSDISIEVDQIVGDKLFLVIKVKERPRISAFSFEGIKKAQADDLKEKINFIRGSILTKSKEQSAKRVIRNFYVEKGFFNAYADITTTEDPVLKNAVIVNIKVNKGRRIKIKEIQMEGLQAFTDKKLKRKLKEVKEKKFWRVWKKSKYIPKEFEKGKQEIISFYNDEGYRDAIIEYDTVYGNDDRTVIVNMRMYEGKQYYHRNIRWVGNYKYNSETLGKVLNVRKGDIYSSTKLQSRLFGDPNGSDVSSLYLDDGYLFFNVDPVEVAIEGDSIDLEMRIFEGPQATIRKIILEGNTKTSDYVVLRELRTRPGDKFSRSDVIRSQREIINLGYFDQENLQVLPIPDPASGTVDIKYTVEERPSDQLQLQGGWGGRVRDVNGNIIAGGFVGTVQLAFNNFSTKKLFKKGAWNPVPSGDGQKLSLAFQMNGVGYQNFSVSFQEPWLGGKKPNLLGIGSSYIVLKNVTSGFRNSIFSFSVENGRRMKFPDDFFQSNTSLTYKYYDVSNPQSVFAGFEDSDRAYINILSLRQTISRSSVDALIFPRSGSMMNFSVEATPPYSLFMKDKDFANMPSAQKFNLLEFHKWKFSSNWFFNLFADLVLSAKIEAAFLGSYNKEIGISPFERFYLGGAGLVGFNGFDGREIISLRGYQDNVIGNYSTSTNQNQGATIYNKFSMEFRYPITLTEAAPMWLLAFVEGGNGYGNFKEYNPLNLKRSAGVGVRIMLPMVGLLGVDWGYGFDDVYDSRGNVLQDMNGSRFHFVFGQQF